MVPRHNLGGDFISFLRLGALGQGVLPLTRTCTYSGDSTRDRYFDSNVSYFLILIKACSIFVCTLHLVLLSLSYQLVMSGKISTPVS